ncbi:LL-diaminopimelate aminotransferase [Paradesulfitobacterium aromaticivorans]
MKHSEKLKHLPPYLFAQLDQLIHEKSAQGQDLIVLSKSDPDRPTHPNVVEILREQAVEPLNHHYPDFDGLKLLREQTAAWYETQYGVKLDPDHEILPLQGSKEGIVHFCQAWLDPGDLALVPDPAFPSYRTGVILAGGKPYSMPLKAPDFLPDFREVPTDIARKAKLMFLNYPNNPTAVTVSTEFWEETLDFARSFDLILVNDHAYAMTKFEHDVAPSLLSVPGSKERSLEFFTFSKAYHMAGWRLGLAVGNAEILQGLKIIETHVNAGIFNPIQYAGAEAMRLSLKPNFFVMDNKAYAERLKRLVDFFNSWGWRLRAPKATVYLWVPAPGNMDGDEFTHFLLEEANVVVAPGSGFGEEGKNYVRFCVTYPDETVDKALKAMHSTFERAETPPPHYPDHAAR